MLGAEFPKASIRFLKVGIRDEAAVDTAVAETVLLLGPVTTLLNFTGLVCCVHGLDCPSKDWQPRDG